jgi:hypothetical protein
MVASSKGPKSPAARAKKPAATKKAAASSTRTSSRSAKRRSPKEPPDNPELLEFERLQFLKAMDKYKRKTGKTFPSWTEVLVVLRSIGWLSPARLSELKADVKPRAAK